MDKHLGYVPALDGVRAFAVLAVMGVHSNLAEFRGGALGVDMFFVLSGFLITKLLLQEFDETGDISLVKFWIRRALRLLPALALLLVAVTAYAYLLAPDEIRRILLQEIVVAALYARNLTMMFGYPDGDIFLGHTWTLGLEEQFYLVWPPVVAIWLRQRRSLRALLMITVATGGLLALLPWAELPSSRLGLFLSFRPAALLFGAALAFVFHLGWLPGRRRSAAVQTLAWAATAYLGACVVFPDTMRFQHDQGLVVAVCTALLAAILLFPPRPMLWILELPVFVATGRISYGLYLWHLPIFRWFNRYGPELNPKAHILLEFGLTFAVSWASYVFMERHFLRLKPR